MFDISARTSWEEALKRHNVCHNCGQNGDKVAQRGYDACHVLVQRSWEVSQNISNGCMFQVRVAGKFPRGAKTCVLGRLQPVSYFL